MARQLDDKLHLGSMVFAWGANEWGQLGHRRITQNQPSRIELLMGKGIISVACGQAHSLALADNGTIFAWGCNKYGQLGEVPSDDPCPKPMKISYFTGSSSDKFVVEISTGGLFSAARTKSGKVFCWGANTHGELGRATKHSYKPKEVVGLPPNIISIQCGDQRCCALSDTGICWVWGRLAARDMLKDNHVPQPMTIFSGENGEDVWISQAACGKTHLAMLENRVMTEALRDLKKQALQGFPNATALHESLDQVPKHLLLPLQNRALADVRSSKASNLPQIQISSCHLHFLADFTKISEGGQWDSGYKSISIKNTSNSKLSLEVCIPQHIPVLVDTSQVTLKKGDSKTLTFCLRAGTCILPFYHGQR